MVQVKEAQRAKQLGEMVDQACSAEAHEEASTHGRQLRPLHAIPGQRKQLMRVRPLHVFPLKLQPRISISAVTLLAADLASFGWPTTHFLSTTPASRPSVEDCPEPFEAARLACHDIWHMACAGGLGPAWIGVPQQAARPAWELAVKALTGGVSGGRARWT